MVTITRNFAKKGIELSFPSKPDPVVSAWLSENKYHWNPITKVRFKKFDEDSWEKVNAYFDQPLTEESDKPITNKEVIAGPLSKEGEVISIGDYLYYGGDSRNQGFQLQLSNIFKVKGFRINAGVDYPVFDFPEGRFKKGSTQSVYPTYQYSIIHDADILLHPTPVDTTKPFKFDDEPEVIYEDAIKTTASEEASQEVEKEIKDEAANEAMRKVINNLSTVGAVRPGIFNDFDSFTLIKGREIQLSMPNGEKRKAVFAIIELDNVIASHNEENFHSDPVYPKNVYGNNINDRNYKDDLSAQKAVMDYARELEPERLITTSRTPSGTPIISKDGFVVSGNNRTMSLKLAAKQYPANYQEYIKYLIEEIESFGFMGSMVGTKARISNSEAAAEFVHPVLVRIDLDFPEYTTQELAKYNKDTKKSERPVDKAIKLSNILRENSRCADIIAEITGEYETFTEFYANIIGQKRLAKTLVECNLLTEQELPAYFSDTTFTEIGKEFIENLLAALILDREALMATEQPGVKAIRQKLITALPVLMKNASLPEGSLKSNINDAVLLQYDMKGSTFQDFIRQQTLFGGKYDKKTVYVNRLIDSGKLKFKQAIEGYNDSIVKNQGPSLFGEKPSTEEVFKHWIIGGVSDIDKRLIESSEITNTATVPKFDEKYLNEQIEKATPNLSKIKDVDAELAEIRGEAPELRKEFLREQDGFKLFWVDGEAVRKDHIEFTSGGHGYVYDWIPKGEIWIDDNQKDKPNDLEAVILHEIFEIKKMRDEGLSYEEAHELANKMEEKIRQGTEVNPQKKLNPFIAFYKDKRYNLYSESKYAAQLKAAEYFKVPAKDSYKVSVKLAVEEETDKPLRAEAEKSISEPKDDIAEVRLQKLILLRKFISVSQHEALSDLMMGEEGAAGWEIVDDLGGIIQTMPHTYQTEKTDTDDKIVYLHYFSGGSDWYIVEKDKLPVQNQAFGYAILNGDTINAEWGYISILELIQNNVELDFYFTPVKFGELQGKWQDREDKNETEEDRKVFGYSFEFDPANEEGSELMFQLRQFGITPKVKGALINVLYPEYKGIEFSMNDNSGEFKLNRAGNNDYPYVIDFKNDDGKLKSIFTLAKQIEDSIVSDVEKNKPVETPLFGTFAGQVPVESMQKAWKENTPIKEVFEAAGNEYPQSASLSLSDYKTDFEKNKAIEKLLLAHPESSYQWSDEEKIFFKGYTGYGGLDEDAIKAGVKLDTGSLDEFYTPDPVIEKMWLLVEKHKLYDIQSICEPSVGIGSFFDRRYVGSHIRKTAYELNPFSARIVKILYPETNINVGADEGYFEQLFIKNNYTVRNKVITEHDLVIGNPPYRAAEGPYMGMGEKGYSHAKNYIDYFIFRGLDVLKKDGLLVYIIGAEVAAGGHPWLDQGNSKCKEMITAKGKLIDAYRLPEGLFDRTNVVCDLIVFRKR